MPGAVTPLGNMVIKLGLDDADFGKGVQGAKKQISYLAKEMQANMKVADMAGNQLGKLGTKFESLGNVVKAQEKQVEALKKAYDGSFVDGKATESTARLATQLQVANGRLADYKAQLVNAAGAIADYKVRNEGLTGAINKTSDAMIKAGDKMQSVGSAMTKGLTLPLAAGVTAVTKAAIDWESAFTGVLKTNNEIVDSNGTVVYSYDDLEKGLRGLAKTLPSSHQAIAEVAESAGQLGIQTDNVVAFTKTMIDMGESTNLSADEAATSMAKFANITGMSQKEFSNLGSSLVALGNNFATTENDIMQMSMRLAGAGHQIGLSTGDITGIATALSSVGIEAEAGGSAFSKLMVSMQLATEQGSQGFDTINELSKKAGVSVETMGKAVSNGGKELKNLAANVGIPAKELSKIYKEAEKSADSLESFSEVAGMTSVQFGTLFKSNPAEALQKFIVGLKDSEKHGKSAISVLDEMGITEVRLRDTLLRAAGASGVFGDAIKMGNKAFKENTALTEEASKRYETTESKLKALKNEVVDAAIDLGGPFVDALRDGVQAAKPLIENLAKMAKAFSNAEPETQRLILKMIAFATVGGPVLSTLGKVTGGVGKLGKGFVDLAAKMASKSAMATATKGITEVGKAATLAAGTGTTGIAGLATGLGAIAGPALIAVGAIAAVGTALYVGKKAYDDHQLAGAKWGTEVTKEQDKVISKSYEMQEKAVGYVNAYADGVVGAGKKAIKANEEIVKSIDNALAKEKERREKSVKGIENETIKQAAEQQAKLLNEQSEIAAKNAKKTIDSINSLIKNATNNQRTLTESERTVIGNMYKSMTDEQLKLAGFNKDQRLAIEEAYQNKISKMTTDQLIERRTAVYDSLSKEAKNYEEQQALIRKTFADNPAQMKKMLDIQEQDYKNSTESMVISAAKMSEKLGYNISDMGETWKRYGYTVDEVQTLVNASNLKASENVDMLAKGVSELDQQWNMLALDPKTGEVKTNMAETLAEIAKTDDGWKQLQLYAKRADITTNAKEEIAVALGAAGKWDNLYLSEKVAMLDGEQARVEMLDTINELGKWNEFNADRKVLGIDNADVVWKMLDSNEKIEAWNQNPTEVKKLLADNSDLVEKIFSSEETMNVWNNLPVEAKQILANNEDLLQKIKDGEITLDGYEAIIPAVKFLNGEAKSVEDAAANGGNALDIYSKNNPTTKILNGNSQNVIDAANRGGNSLNIYSGNNPAEKFLKGNASSAVNASNQGVGGITRWNGKYANGKNLNAYDYASQNAYNAANAVQTFDNKPNVITKTLRVISDIGKGVANFFGWETGTDFHPGGMALVNDQRGPLYKELVQLPNGKAFIPQERNVFLDLPRGSKVLKASHTKRLFPNYENGVGIPENSVMVQRLRSVNSQNVNIDNREMVGLMKQMLNVIARLNPQINIYPQNLNSNQDFRRISNELAMLTKIDERGMLE